MCGVILRRHSPNALELAAANAVDRNPAFIVKTSDNFASAAIQSDPLSRAFSILCQREYTIEIVIRKIELEKFLLPNLAAAVRARHVGEMCGAFQTDRDVLARLRLREQT
jgi:hypothetical protein